jgi:DNA-binding GntR family transcriptional regulator
LRLEQEGILEQSGRKGFSIRKITGEEVRALYGAREAIEGYAAYMIADKKNAAQLAVIETAVDAERQLTNRDLDAEFRINREIHRTIVEQSSNPVLLDMFDSLWGRGISLWLFAATRKDQTPPRPDLHAELLNILKTGTPQEAQAAMIAHIRDGLDSHLKGLD